MDAQTQVRDAAPLVALIQSLACLELESEPSSAMPSPEVLGENRFLAARDGMDARLIDPESRCLVPAREILDSLLADCWEPALSLGGAGALVRVPRLAAANGAERQHALVATSGHLDRLVPTLADWFVAPHSRTATAATNLHTSGNPTERSGICAAGSHTQAPPS
jgi:glutamate---cysteine ligase / carboxylate-amine ligase